MLWHIRRRRGVGGPLGVRGLMVAMMRRRGRRRAAQRPPELGRAALEYAAMGWPGDPGAHPVSPTWQMQATTDSAVIRQWWETRPEANVILVTGRVFDVLDVPAVAGATVLARMAAAGGETGAV